MRLFLDTSMMLAACASSNGASREVFNRAKVNGWCLLASPYVIEEVLVNLPALPAAATAEWAHLRPGIALVDDVLTLDRI